MSWYGLIGVLRTEVDVVHCIVLYKESVSSTLGLKLHLNIHTIVDNDMKRVLEPLDFISNATHSDGLLFLGLNDTIPLDDFPDGILIFGERGILGINLTNICNFECLALVIKHFHLTKV